MSARETDAPDAYLLGHEDGRRDSVQLALARLLTAEDIIRVQGDELDAVRTELDLALRRNRRLRARLANPIVTTIQWSIVTAVFTFIATWNVAT